jgi:glycosyltransferase involved in cell wall biosynthesis
VAEPLVSVVMPSFNHQHFVAEAIGSLIDQTFEDWELVVTDDGSTDGTVAVIRAFDDPRIRLHVFERNRGACPAMNDAIARARGRYIAVLNSDDAFLPHKLATQLEYLAQHPDRAAVFARAEFMDEDSEPLAPGTHHYTGIFDHPYPGRHALLRAFFMIGNRLCHPSVLIRAEVYRDVGLYDPRLAQLPDFEMWVRILLRGYEIEVMDFPLVRFRILGGGLQNASGVNRVALARCDFEMRLVLRRFLAIRDPNEFAAIFFPDDPGAAARLAAQDLPAQLGLFAATSPSRLYREFAAEVLYDAMAGDGAARLAERFGFTPADYIRLTGRLLGD